MEIIWLDRGQINREHSQVELLVPDRVEVAEDGLRPALGLPHLDSDIRVAGAGFILGLQALRTPDWKEDKEGEVWRVRCHKQTGNLTILRFLF